MTRIFKTVISTLVILSLVAVLPAETTVKADQVEFAIENDSVDFEVTEDEYNIYCEVSNLHSLNEKIINKFNSSNTTQLIWKSDVNTNVEKNEAEKLFKLLNLLEENEDVQSVSSNFEVSDEIMNQLTV